MSEKKVAFRMDDVGSASKIYAQYSYHSRLMNIGPLKIIKRYKGWAPYDELSASQLSYICEMLDCTSSKLTVGITATFVEKCGSLIPYYEKFPKQLEILKIGVDNQLIQIANHGLTHCIVENRKFLPKFWTGNGRHHREFLATEPDWRHWYNLIESQKILFESFGYYPKVFVPPGNMYTKATIEAAEYLGFEFFNCAGAMPHHQDLKMRVLGNENVIDFHDKEVSELGLGWFKEKIIVESQHSQLVFVSDL
jgi:hypothetical protein